MKTQQSDLKKNLWTPPKLVEWISNDLEAKEFPPPFRLQAEQLVSAALGISRLELYLQFDKPCTADEQKTLRTFLKRRYQREPIAYILGQCEFWSLQLKVGPGVLIPRQETEILVETILKLVPELPSSAKTSFLELGTGSAAIPLALCSEKEHLEIVSTDISAAALFYAQKNARIHAPYLEPKGNRLLIFQGDRFAAVHPQKKFDFIISNPPYIPKPHINGLHKEVKDWEPNLALSGGKTGIDFYLFLRESAMQFLKPGGYLVFEHGYDQLQEILNLMQTEPALRLVEQLKDYGGLDRVLSFQKKP